MKDPIAVLQNHHIQGAASCIAWAVEFILKLHEKRALDNYDLQTAFATGMGFGSETQTMLDGEEITAWDEEYTWKDFERIAKEDASNGMPLIFSFPTQIHLDFINSSFAGMVCHGAVAVIHPKIDFITRAYNHPHLISLPMQNFRWSLKRAPIYYTHKPATASPSTSYTTSSLIV